MFVLIMDDDRAGYEHNGNGKLKNDKNFPHGCSFERRLCRSALKYVRGIHPREKQRWEKPGGDTDDHREYYE